MNVDWEQHVAVLKAGGVVACPTETFFGLLADARDARAVERVCRLKGRAPEQAIAVIVPSRYAAVQLAAEWTKAAERLARRHWPGPLTLVVRARAGLPPPLLHGDTIGVRVPGPSAALELARAFGGALTATSANRSGAPPARTVQELGGLAEAVDALVGGEAPGGEPSTLIDVTGAEPRVLRPGAVRV